MLVCLILLFELLNHLLNGHPAAILVLWVFLCQEEQRVVHKVVVGHKLDIFGHLLADRAHVSLLEPEELVLSL